MSITGSTFDHNAGFDGGAGAIYVGVVSPATVIVADSAFTENFVSSITGTPAINIGSNGLVVVTNSTFARNSNPGITNNVSAISNSGQLIMINSTVADNTAIGSTFAQDRLGALWSTDSATTILVNTIVARNTAGALNADCGGPVTSLGQNFIGTSDGCGIVLQPSDDLTDNPGLGAFTDNGVPGNGHFPLLPASQAVDAGDEAVCPRTDQIGDKRKGPCDIGAIGFNKKRPNGKSGAEQDSAVSRTDGSDIAEDLIQAVTALKSPTAGRDENSRQLKSLLDLVGSLLSSVSPVAP